MSDFWSQIHIHDQRKEKTREHEKQGLVYWHMPGKQSQANGRRYDPLIGPRMLLNQFQVIGQFAAQDPLLVAENLWVNPLPKRIRECPDDSYCSNAFQ